MACHLLFFQKNQRTTQILMQFLCLKQTPRELFLNNSSQQHTTKLFASKLGRYATFSKKITGNGKKFLIDILHEKAQHCTTNWQEE